MADEYHSDISQVWLHHSWRHDPVLPVLMVLVGVVVIALMSYFEARAQDAQPFRDAALIVGDWEPSPDASPCTFRRLPLDLYPTRSEFIDQLRVAPDGQKIIDQLALEGTESFIALGLPLEQWDSLLESGRMPRPGEPEVLAGDLAVFDRFEFDGTEFEVVGHIRRSIPGFTRSYVLPLDFAWDDLFSEDQALQGWFDPAGLSRLEESEPEYLSENVAVLNPLTRAGAPTIAGVFLGMLLVCIGGALLQVRILTALGRRWHGFPFDLFHEMEHRPRLLLLVHAACYACFFGPMLLALATPAANLHAQQLIQATLEEGPGISSVMDAYQERNIPLAAVRTWGWNYGVATCLLTILPSITVPVFGVVFAIFKNLASFGAVGYILAPIWTGEANDLTFHCITMTLELEAYVLAIFMVITVWIRIGDDLFAAVRESRIWHVLGTFFLMVLPIVPMAVIFFIARPALAGQALPLPDQVFILAFLGLAAALGVAFVTHTRALTLLISGIVTTGIMLAVAGLYEAVTIILLRG
jgi:hypothetical protein